MVDSPFLSTIVLSKNRPFFLGLTKLRSLNGTANANHPSSGALRQARAHLETHKNICEAGSRHLSHVHFLDALNQKGRQSMFRPDQSSHGAYMGVSFFRGPPKTGGLLVGPLPRQAKAPSIKTWQAKSLGSPERIAHPNRSHSEPPPPQSRLEPP